MGQAVGHGPSGDGGRVFLRSRGGGGDPGVGGGDPRVGVGGLLFIYSSTAFQIPERVWCAFEFWDMLVCVYTSDVCIVISYC